MSDVWNFYKDKTPNSAICVFCDKKINRCNNTSRLIDHIVHHKMDGKLLLIIENVMERRTLFFFSKQHLITFLVVMFTNHLVLLEIIMFKIQMLFCLDCELMVLRILLCLEAVV